MVHCPPPATPADRVTHASARLVAETAPVGLVALRSDGSWVFANTAVARLLGYSDPEALMSVPVWRLHRHPEVALDILRERLGSGDLSDVRLDVQRLDGSPVQVRIHARALALGAGELLLVGSVEDLTRPMVEQEESAHAEKMEAVARFAAGVAHDYNNLLTSIIGEARQLLSEGSADGSVHTGANAILTAARTASRLTQRLLVFAKSEVVRTEVLDLAQAIRGLEGSMAGLLPEDVTVIWRVDADTGFVRIAPRHLEHIIANLVTNARDAMPAGGAVVIETGRTWAPDDTDGVDFHPPVLPGEYASFAIGDRGVGMNREVRRRIFDPFFTTKRVGEGAGLGLTTVYALVQRAGGHIAVMSAPAYGTVARVLLPLCPPVQGGAAPAKAAPRPGEGRRPVVLVVDDDPAVRSVMVRSLARAGCDVLEAPDALAAQTMVRSRQGPLDLMVTDVMMPRVKGTELARWLRAVRPDTAILLVSGYLDSVQIQAWVDEDPDVFLSKPFEPAELVDRAYARLRTRGLGPAAARTTEAR